MPQRPLSITIVASVLLALAALSIPGLAASALMPEAKQVMALSPLPVPLQWALGIAGLLIQAVSGVALLKRRDWGRWLYVVWQVLSIVIGLATSPMKLMLVPGVLIFVVIAFFLFTRKANAWFRAAPAAADA